MRDVPMTLEPPADGQALPALGSDGPARLRSAIDAHYEFVARALRGLGVLEREVDDVAQEVFLVFTKRAPEVAVPAERSFLFQTALRIASRARRSLARRREVSDGAAAEPIDPSPSPEDLSDQRRARELLDRVLDEMELDLRSVFVLFEIEELSTVEIAELLDVPTGTVASRLRRARDEFQAKVKRLAARRGGGAP